MFKKPALIVAGVALVAGGTAACGGTSGPPSSASTADFCGAFNYGIEQIMANGASFQNDTGKQVDLIHKWADKMKSTGTPKGIPADARKGFEISVDKFSKISEKDLSGNNVLQNLDSGLSATDKKDLEAFGTYQTSTCKAYPPKGMPSMPSAPAS